MKIWGNQFFKETPLSYLNKKVVKTDYCWIWKGPYDKDGYGKAVGIQAHRLAYQTFKGDIPEGMMVCHHCDNPPCCNPDHLWLGTNSDNQTDSVRKYRNHNVRKTHCINGHEYNEANTYLLKTGGRYCRACHAERERIRRARSV